MSQDPPICKVSRKHGPAFFIAIALLCAALTVLGWRSSASATTLRQAASPSCANSAAILDPEPADLVADCETLLGLKDELAGEASLNWNAALSMSDWEGITVDHARVSELALGGKGLSGRIPAELSNLTNLTRLDLSFNHLTGNIPVALGHLTNLTRLELVANQLSGEIPGELGALTNLEVLFLSFNQLTGTIPAELGNLSNLNRLVLVGNDLSGEIPGELGALTNLEVLFLSFNQLTGTIPAELGNLSNLNRLVLVGNDLSGEIPGELEALTNLEALLLSFNQLTGPVPPALGNLANLRGLDLFVNELTGTIPAHLGNLSKLESLSLGDNHLTGTIPVELGRLTNLRHLSLRDNQLTGLIPPALAKLTKLERLYLGDNDLTGIIPTWLADLTKLDSLNLSGNQLTGPVPVELATLTNLTRLWLSFNRFTGTVPVELGALTNLTDLHLSFNQLTGTIPTELGALTKLTSLNVSNNQLVGTIPAELANLTILSELVLSDNQLEGNIPAELGKLINLHVLYLHSNDLTGTIPAELGDLTNLTLLNLSDNNLTGPIPPELDNLVPPAGNLSNVRISTGNLGMCGPIPPALHAFSPTEPSYVNDLDSDNHPTGTLGSCSPLSEPELVAEAKEGVVELSWHLVSGAVRYELWVWWDKDTGWQQIGGDSLTGTRYRHESVSVGTKYFYVILAVNAAGEKSAWPGQERSYHHFSATVVDPSVSTPPSVPTLEADPRENSVDLSWQEVTGAVRYELWVWWNSDTSWQQIGGDNLTGTTFSHKEVATGTKYYYTILAVNAAGEKSAWPGKERSYHHVSATVPGPSATSPLSEPTLEAVASEGEVELSWTEVSGAERYELWVWWNGTSRWQQLGGDNLTDSSYRHSDVSAGTTYYYTILALNAVGEKSAWPGEERSYHHVSVTVPAVQP